MSDQFVYFIQADEDGPIKIGFTAGDPLARLNQLQTGNASALKLLGSIKATVARERELHKSLAEWRLQGEWFKPHPTVLEAVELALSEPIEEHQSCGGSHCSFCGICQHDTLLLIAGQHGTFICCGCTAMCAEIVSKELLKVSAAVSCPLEEAGAGG